MRPLASTTMSMFLENGICAPCRSRFFNFSAFRTAFSAKDFPNHEREHALSYITQPWHQIEEGEDRLCNWCDILWDEILDFRRSYLNQSKRTKEMPRQDEMWKMTIWFQKKETDERPSRVNLRYIIEDETGDEFFTKSLAVHTEPSKEAFHWISLILG